MLKKILVVDDESMIRSFLSLLIKNLHYYVVCAEDGVDGLAKFNEEMPDLIITDMFMPNMNGKDMIDAIRKTERGKNIPIIILSGYTKPNDIMTYIKQDNTYFLKKPVEITEINEYLTRLIGN